MFNNLEQLVATNELKKLWFFISSNGVEKHNSEENK